MLTLEGLSGSFWMTSLLVLPPGERFSLVWKDSMFSWRLLSDFLDSRTQSSGSLCFVVLISGLGLCLSWQSLFLKSMNLMMTDEEKSTLSHGPALHTKLCLSCNFTFTHSLIWKIKKIGFIICLQTTQSLVLLKSKISLCFSSSIKIFWPLTEGTIRVVECKIRQFLNLQNCTNFNPLICLAFPSKVKHVSVMKLWRAS